MLVGEGAVPHVVVGGFADAEAAAVDGKESWEGAVRCLVVVARRKEYAFRVSLEGCAEGGMGLRTVRVGLVLYRSSSRYRGRSQAGGASTASPCTTSLRHSRP